MAYSMACPRCGLIQSAAPACKSCGARAEGGAAARSSMPAPSFEGRPSDRANQATAPLRRLFFHGAGGTLFGIKVVNLLLSLITLGIYSFWGRVKVRSYLLGQAEFESDRFAYHGTGKELLVGFLKALVVFGLPIGFLSWLPAEFDLGNTFTSIAGVAVYLIVMILVPFAAVAARRYRLSRSSWRGIRFTFRGRIFEFIKLFLLGSLLSTITLGLYYPIYAADRYAFLTSHSYFGNERFNFDGSGRDLFGSFLVAILLTLPTLGLCWFWFIAKKQRYLWNHTSFASARFRSTVTGGRLLALRLGNLLLMGITLGLGWAWVVARNIRFTFAYLALEGPLDLAVIAQEAELASATGEGLAGLIDLDAGFDLG